MRFLLALSLIGAAGAGAAPPAASERAAFQLAIAATKIAPPDLADLIVQFRREYLAGVREAEARPIPGDLETAARSLSRGILQRMHFTDAVGRCGQIVGTVVAREAPGAGDAGAAEFGDAAAGPYRVAGISSRSAAGDASAASRSVARARAELSVSRSPAEAAASRIVEDSANLLWAIWTGAGGDARAAGKWNEKNGPYDVTGISR